MYTEQKQASQSLKIGVPIDNITLCRFGEICTPIYLYESVDRLEFENCLFKGYCFFLCKGTLCEQSYFSTVICSKLPRNDIPKFNFCLLRFFNILQNFHKEIFSFVTSYLFAFSKRVLTLCIYNLKVVKISVHF